MAKLLDTLASTGFIVSLQGTGGKRPTVKIPKEGKETLAQKYGLDASLVKAGLSALPAPHDSEWKELMKSHGSVRSKFYDATMPLSSRLDASDGAGSAKRSASGDRFLVAKKITSGEFSNQFTLAGAGMTPGLLYDALSAARSNAASMMSTRVQEVLSSGKLGDLFADAVYPDYNDIQAGWFYEPIQLRPLARTDVLEGMFLPADIAMGLEAQMEAQAQEQVKFGQQTLIAETIDNLKTMTANLTKLSDWYRDQKGRRPSIYDSLVTNIQKSLTKLRDYALPETDEGQRILDIVASLEESLDLASISADDLKQDPRLASQTARDAERAAKKLQRVLELIWDDTPIPAHVQAASNTDSLDDLLLDFAA